MLNRSRFSNFNNKENVEVSYFCKSFDFCLDTLLYSSLQKFKFISGKYICDGDSDSRTRYAAPPSNVD